MSATATQRFTEAVRIDPILHPADQAVDTHDSAWFSMRDYHRAFVLLDAGAIPSGATVDLSVRQAKDDSGSGAKAITGKSVTQLTDADDDKLVGIEIDASELDATGRFDHISVRTVVGTDTVFLGVILFRHQPRYSPAGVSQFDEVVV